MALFKPFKGSRASLDTQPLHDGYAYFCTDDGSFHIDYVDAEGNLQRKQINAKDAETLMGMSLDEIKEYVATQPDWSVNDETNPAYVKNRTHWVEVVPTTFINNETLSFSPYADPLYMYSGSLSYDFAIDNIYNVIWDNTEYVCTSFNYMGYPAIGNTNIIGVSNDDATEPFFAYVASGTIVMVTNSTDASHIVSLSGDVVTYHTINKNYLPHLVGTSGTGANSEVFNEYTGYNVAEGEYSHAEGYNTKALGSRSHSEGWLTEASGHNSHAEGCDTVASGSGAHAEGNSTEATGRQAHAEGDRTVASAWAAHAEGIRTTAASNYQHAQGMLNITDSDGKYLHIVGNGTFDATSESPSNAHTLDWSGNAWFAGDVKVGGTGQDDENAKTLATTEYVDSKAVRPDWSIHDENDPSYIKNRTHWSKAFQVEILSECQPEAIDGGFKLENKVDVVVGHTYTVNWNGTPYTCVAGTVGGLTVIGNGSQFGLDDTGEPFFMIFYPDSYVSRVGYYVAIASLDGSTACTLSIIEHLEDIHKIDNKYLSDEIVAERDWNATEDEFGHILNRTHYTEEVLEEIIPETTVTFGDATNPGRDTGTATGSAIQIYPEHGEQFIIEWNGVKYYSEAREYTKTDGSFGRGVGNTGMFGGGGYAQYPFLIGFLTEEEAATSGHTYFVWVNDESTTATFSVGKIGEAVHRLDAKYLPENIATVEYVDEQIAANMVQASQPKMTTVTIPVANWTGDTNPWSQVVTINGVTENSKVDLQPTALQIVSLQDAEITLMLQNDAGVVTAWAIGNKPTEDYTMQVLITEVVSV